MRGTSKMPIMSRKQEPPVEQRRDVRAPTLLSGTAIVSARPFENGLKTDNDAWNFAGAA
jgi:hypothetical protein